MADKTILLTGNGAGVFCKGLVETGKFFRLRAVPMEKTPSGLYAAGESGSCISSRRIVRRNWSAMIYGNEPDNNGKDDKSEGLDTAPEEQLSKSPEYNAISSPLYMVRASQSTIAVVLEALKTRPMAFVIDANPDMNCQTVHCNGTLAEISMVLREIQTLFAVRRSA